jgi:phosphate transport system substrate-binding protein
MHINRRSLLAGAAGLLVPAPMAALAGPNDILAAGGNTLRPIMNAWQEAQAKTLGLNITYEAIGSPAAISKILAGIVDFAVIENPLSDEQLNQSNLYQFPLAFGAIVFVVNIPGVEGTKLTLTAQNLAGIFGGTIKKWNDPKILASNPGLTLPDLEVKPIYHSNMHGGMFTDTIGVTTYLSETNADWRERFKTGVPRRWSVGSMSASGETITQSIRALEGSIGYLPLGAAARSKLAMVVMQNDKGKIIPNRAALTKALTAIDWAKVTGTIPKLVDLPGEGVWPIVLCSYGVVPKDLKGKQNGAAILSFFKFALTQGAEISVQRGGEPLPEAQRARVLGVLEKFMA